jgi:hypothetical protein
LCPQAKTRGIAVLEAIGSPEAKKVLAKLAESHPDNLYHADAAEALARLEKRSGGGDSTLLLLVRRSWALKSLQFKV